MVITIVFVVLSPAVLGFELCACEASALPFGPHPQSHIVMFKFGFQGILELVNPCWSLAELLRLELGTAKTVYPLHMSPWSLSLIAIQQR
jgi:hypothetical protein